MSIYLAALPTIKKGQVAHTKDSKEEDGESH
jgi:hypothetical protein